MSGFQKRVCMGLMGTLLAAVPSRLERLLLELAGSQAPLNTLHPLHDDVMRSRGLSKCSSFRMRVQDIGKKGAMPQFG